MIHQLKVTYGPRIMDGSFGMSATFSGYGFDDSTLSIVPVAGTWRGAFLEPTPADVDVPENSPFWFDCSGATAANEYEALGYYHVRAGATFRTAPEPQCMFCGFVPPVTPAPTCELVANPAVVVGQQVTLSASGNRGPLRFSLDDELTTQASAVFNRLSAGDYTATIIDTGTPGCKRTVTFRVYGAAGPLPDIPAPVGAPESVSLALAPVWETITGLIPGTLLRLELWMESSHQDRDYQRVYRAQKVAGNDGAVSFRLDGVLSSRLRHEPLAADATDCVLVERAVLNYFCRTKVLDKLTGLERDPRNLPLRTALLASLDQPGGWLTNQPNGKILLPGQAEHLYWLSPRQVSGAVTVRRALGLANGLTSVDQEVVQLASAGVARYRLLAVPVLPGGSAPAGALRAEVQILDEDGVPLTCIRYYHIEQPAPSVVHRQFVFATPFGGLDTLVTSGNGTKTLEVKAETAERGEQQGDGPGTPTAWHWGLEEQRRHRVATGWLSKEQLHWLQGFVLARQIWRRHAGVPVPILPVKRQLGHERDQPLLEGLTFEYELASAQANREQVR